MNRFPGPLIFLLRNTMSIKLECDNQVHRGGRNIAGGVHPKTPVRYYY